MTVIGYGYLSVSGVSVGTKGHSSGGPGGPPCMLFVQIMTVMIIKVRYLFGTYGFTEEGVDQLRR